MDGKLSNKIKKNYHIIIWQTSFPGAEGPGPAHPQQCGPPTDERSEEDVQRVSRCGKQFLDPEYENLRGFVAKDCEIQSWIEAEYLF